MGNVCLTREQIVNELNRRMMKRFSGEFSTPLTMALIKIAAIEEFRAMGLTGEPTFDVVQDADDPTRVWLIPWKES